MRSFLTLALALAVFPAATALAQVPYGGITGTIRDVSAAGVPRATVLIVNSDTGQAREVLSSDRGDYAAPDLPPGTYRVAVEAAGFRRTEQSVQVRVGTANVVDLTLQVGNVAETVTVNPSTQLNRDHHQVDGVVSRTQIQSLPLNGRNFLELAKLEPGVTSPVRGTNNRTFIASLGSGLQTIPRVSSARVTMDGANVGTLGGIGTVLQVSPEAIEEFQIATVNLDTSTSFSSNVAVNIVTRAGSNTMRGSGAIFYRDDQMAAHPGLARDPENPDPFFRRVQGGMSLGGPIRSDRAFFFASYERTDQHGVVSVQPSAPEFAPLGGIFPTPLSGNLLMIRIDAQPHLRHHAVFRHGRDDNRAFGPLGAMGTTLLPSAWSEVKNRVDQSLGALTSIVSRRAVNDARFAFLSMSTPDSPAEPKDCPGCFGLGSPRTIVSGAGLTFGQARTVTFEGWRAQLTDDLSLAIGGHQVRFGLTWEHSSIDATLITQEPAQLTLWSPQQVLARNSTIPLPAAFTTVEDVFQLPLRSFQTGVGSDGNLQRGFRATRLLDVIRLYSSDTWRVSPRSTVNFGLSWVYEPNALNYDLSKPALLIPLLGADRLGPPAIRRASVSPLAGWTWMATADGKTLVRTGVGHYVDGTSWVNSIHLVNERRYLMPLGNGRFTVSGANILFEGRPLDFRQPTALTGQQLLNLLPGVRTELEAALRPGNRDFSLRNLNRAKEGSNLADPDYTAPSAIHAGLGVQRELPFGIVASADVVYKRFKHTFLNGIDYNRFYSASGPVIPECTPAQRNDDQAVCSNGPIYFDTTAGRARYRGLLVRVEKRLSAGTQLLASYALGSYSGTNGSATGTVESTGGRATGFNSDNWFENDGPLPSDVRHVLNASGIMMVPWRFEVSFNVAAHSRPPFSPYVLGLDFNRDGTSDDLLPGSRVNQFGHGLDRDDLARLVNAYNRDVANRVFNVGGTPVTAPPIVLPPTYDFNDGFFSADVRVGRSFNLGAARRLFLFVEVFNLFNTRNLVDYGSDASNTATFGQPGAGLSQVFGSGGPRAAQAGARVRF